MCVLIGARIRAVLRDSNQGVYGWIRDAPARTSFPIMLNYGTVQVRPGCGISIFLRGFAQSCAR
jgi:hypothetical protein